MTSSKGMKLAARQEASALPTPSAGMHVFVATQDFSIQWNGCTISFPARTRHSVESALKAAILATDRDVFWES